MNKTRTVKDAQWVTGIYADHKIIDRADDRATLDRYDSDHETYYRTEIIQGNAGTLVIHCRNGPNIAFQSGKEQELFRNLVGWVANSTIPDIHEKVIMGTVYRFDSEAARSELQEHMASFNADSWVNAATPEALENFCKGTNWCWTNEDEYRLHDAVLSVIDEDAHQIFPLGHVPSLNFLGALAACKRLHELLTVR